MWNRVPVMLIVSMTAASVRPPAKHDERDLPHTHTETHHPMDFVGRHTVVAGMTGMTGPSGTFSTPGDASLLVFTP